MKIPLSWLKDYVDINLPVEALAERLTLAGLEVESIRRIGELWDRDKIFVGQILDVKRHPEADRLTLVRVEYGAGTPLRVVTGAPNLYPYIDQDFSGGRGPKVAFALAGARLVDGHSEERKIVKLKPNKIRGIMSEGMVCSEKELDLSDEHEGNLILPDDAPVGMPLIDYMGDSVLEFRDQGRFRPPAVRGRHRPRGRRADRAAVPPRRAHHPRPPARADRPRRGFHRHRHRRARPLPALFRGADRGDHDRPVADVDAAAAHARRHAAHQQRGRRDQLRHAGAGPAAARVRLRPAAPARAAAAGPPSSCAARIPAST